VTDQTPKRLRLVFAGTPQVAIPSLDALVAAGRDGADHTIAAVISREDAPLGRKRVLTPSPVARRAAELGLHTIKANRLDDAVTAEVGRLSPDLGVIVAYGGLVREPLLSTPRLGWINLHFSLLPRWRGAAPVQRTIMAGDTISGASVFQLVPALDAGSVFQTISQPIDPDETAGELLSRLAVAGASMLARTVQDIANGRADPTEQHGEVTLAPKLTIDDARLHWDQPDDAVYNRLRAVTPEPGAFTEISLDGSESARLKIMKARRTTGESRLRPGTFTNRSGHVLIGTATHPLELLSVQPAGRREMAAVDWWRGLTHSAEVIAR
jgi:methionyl-tRNA formyltransferase